MTSEFREGVRLFNSQRYFEAHEALEAIWLKAHGQEKLFLHGLIQVAAAFHHYTRDNRAGFRSLLEKGCEKLARHARSLNEIDLTDLLRQLQPWREWINRGGATISGEAPPLPRIEIAPAGPSPR